MTTPQDVALLDVRKALAMFRKLNVPILGIVENMSSFICPSDQKRYDIFGTGKTVLRGGFGIYPWQVSNKSPGSF